MGHLARCAQQGADISQHEEHRDHDPADKNVKRAEHGDEQVYFVRHEQPP